MFHELDVGLSALLTDIAMCINYYRLFSPGMYCCVHATVQLDDGTRFCPGIVVQVNHGPLKQGEPDPDYKYFNGPPNFVLDVFGDDLLDYEHRRECFERAKVIEYVAVRLTDPLEWTWNRLIDGKFSEIKTADNELIMSTALPGLWIPSYALKNQNWGPLWARSHVDLAGSAIISSWTPSVARTGRRRKTAKRSTTTKADGWAQR